MKIAISGTAGIGKSTLARALAEKLAVALIDEGYEDFYRDKHRLRQPPAQVMPLFHAVFASKRQQETQQGEFVTDRCPVDLFHLWQVEGLGAQHEPSREFFTQCCNATQQYDFVVLPPWGSLKLEQIENPADHKRRVMNPWVQLRNHATITGYVHLWLPPEKIIQLPPSLRELDQRVNRILQIIQQRGM